MNGLIKDPIKQLEEDGKVLLTIKAVIDPVTEVAKISELARLADVARVAICRVLKCQPGDIIKYIDDGIDIED